MAFTQIRRRTLLFVSAVAMASATPSFAQEEASESHLAAARAAVASIDTTDQFNAVLMNAATQVKGDLIANHPDRQAELSEMVDEAAIALAPRRADLETEIARIYADLFTEEELRSIAEFYNSEAGQKLIQQGPLATRGTMAAAEIWADGIVRDLQAAADEGARAIVPAGEAGAAPAPQ